jgi:hypothetical protein
MVAAAYSPMAPQNVLTAFTMKIPKEGPRYVPLAFDFTQFVTYGVDIMLLKQNGHISSIQGLYIDNSTNTAAVSISTGQGQTITVPPGYQAYLPIVLNDNPKFTVTSTGTECEMLALNWPVFPQVWNAI